MKQKIKNLIKPLYYWIYFRYNFFLEKIFPSKIKDPKKIPIIINNFNRLKYLKILIDVLEQKGYKNLYIIDNASTYPPLLEYYKKCPYQIFYLERNIGYLALWETKVFRQFKDDFYVYTDSDVVPIEECPDDFMALFLDSLKKYKFARKVGFSLKIDDLPDYYERKHAVINWEKQFFAQKTNESLYRAPIDTTFALYRPRVKGGSNSYIPMYRTAYPYEARHLPWYINSKNLTEEDIYYIEYAKTSTMWTLEDRKAI